MAAKCHVSLINFKKTNKQLTNLILQFICKEYEIALEVLECEDNGVINKTLDESNIFSDNDGITNFNINGRNVTH